MSIPLIKEFNYDAPLEEVWQALTDPGKMRKWYFPQLQKFEPVAGYQIQFDDNNDAYHKIWIVTKVVDGKTLAHSWAYKGYPGNPEVIFDLFEAGKQTRLRITQTGLESFPSLPHFKRERFESGWDNLLGKNLKDLLENSSEVA